MKDFKTNKQTLITEGVYKNAIRTALIYAGKKQLKRNSL